MDCLLKFNHTRERIKLILILDRWINDMYFVERGKYC